MFKGNLPIPGIPCLEGSPKDEKRKGMSKIPEAPTLLYATE